MTEWCLVSEYLALIVTVIIGVFYFDLEQPSSKRRTHFWICLCLTATMIILDIAAVAVVGEGDHLPVALNYALNTVYCFVSIVTSCTIALFFVCRIYEFVFDKRGRLYAFVSLAAVLVAFSILLIINVQEGFFFFINDGGVYQRGQWGSLVYFVPLYGAFLVAFCFFRNRHNVSGAVRQIIIAAPLVVVLLVLYQLCYKDLLLNGTIAMIINLMCFINFLNIRIETDALTRVFNRRSFSSELELCAASKRDYQIVVVALRHFAQINHIYGHNNGDALLFLIADKLQKLMPEGRCFRYNSVEFLLFMPAASEDVQEERINRIKKLMDGKWCLGEGTVWVQYCLAEICNRGEEWTLEEAVEHLDYTVQVAKDEHRKLVRYDSVIIRRYEREEELEHAIKRALRMGTFEVWYQPVFYRETQSFDSAEALLRMTDSEGNRISPGEFIPVAERNGLIDSLSWLVLEDACRLLGSGEAPGLKSVSINLTTCQLLQDDLVQRILWVLEKHKVDPSQIKIEITERTIAENENSACLAMEEACSSGLSFMLDDFGTGYSNFSMVTNMPFEAVKLDRSLVSGLPCERKSCLMVEMLTLLFHELGQNVLAEGIETKEQAETALSYGVDRIQGFFYAKPMPGAELAAWYREKEQNEPTKQQVPQE